MKKLSLMMAAIIAISIAGCTPKSDANSTGESTAKEQLIVGTSADYAPYEFHKLIDGKDEILGFDMALAKEIALDMDKELVIKDMDFKLLLAELAGGKIDMIIAGFSPDPNRDATYSDIYYRAEQVVLSKKDSGISDISSIKGKQIGAQTGSIQEKLVIETMPDGSLVSLAKIPNLVAELKAGKIDALVMEKPVADGYLSAHPDLELAFNIESSDGGSAVAVKTGNFELVEQINKTIASVVESGAMDEFVKTASEQAEY